MTEIAYTGLHSETLNEVLLYLNKEEVRLVEYTRPDLVGHEDVLLIGEEIENPFSIAQQVYKQDRHISILIIKDPEHLQNCKQALLFTPFIGKTVKCFSNEDAKMLASTISEVASQTLSRRNYQKLKGTLVPIETVANVESLKRAYVDSFFDQAPIGAVLVDKNGVVLSINNQVTNLLSCSESEMLGKPFSSFFSEKEARKLHRIMEGETRVVRDEIVGRNIKEDQFLQVTVSNINESRFSDYRSILLSDVTERMQSRKRIEEQLEELNASNEELKKVNTDLDNFIYTASHDLKAPVSNIEGLIHSLRDTLVDEYGIVKPDTETLLGMIDESVSRFQETLLDLTEIIKTQRIEGEDVKHIDCASIIKSVIVNLQEELEKAGGEIETMNAPGCTIKFSKKNFRSIIYNLISNAIKYRSPDRKLKILVKTEKIEDSVVLTVKDNGLGISNENKSRMFTMFKRFHDHVEGTGIGLYIVKRIIDNSGGKIEVDSEVGKGTTFRVLF